MGVTEFTLAGGLVIACALAAYAFIRAHRVQRRARTLFEHLPETGVTVYDRDLRVKFAAGEVVRQIGWDPDEIEGKRLPDLMPDPQGEQLIAHQVAALRGEQRSFEYRSVAHRP